YNLLQSNVQRERHEGQEVVGDARDDRGAGRQDAAAGGNEMDVGEQPDDEPVIGEDRLPGQRADEIGDEERRDDAQEQQVLPAATPERDPVRHGIADNERDQGGQAGVDERALELAAVALERAPVVAPLPGEVETEDDAPRLQRLVDEI